MVYVTKEFTFEACHFLPHYDGKCREPHGHSYRLQVTIKGSMNPDTKMVMDFSKLKKIVEENVIDKHDHGSLNTIYGDYSTAENMVYKIYGTLLPLFYPHGVELHCVKLWETATCFAEYYGGGI